MERRTCWSHDQKTETTVFNCKCGKSLKIIGVSFLNALYGATLNGWAVDLGLCPDCFKAEGCLWKEVPVQEKTMSPEEARRLARQSYRPFPNHRPKFHRDIAARAKEKGISQIDLAKQLGVSPSRLSDWLAGRRSMPMAAVEQAVGLLGGRLEPARVEWNR